MGWWSSVGCDIPYSGLGQVKLNAQSIHGWWSSIGCDSFRDKTHGDIKTLGNNIQGCIIWGRNVWGHNIAVPKFQRKQTSQFSTEVINE